MPFLLDVQKVVRISTHPHFVALPLPRGKALALPPLTEPLLPLPELAPRLFALLCFMVDTVLGVTDCPIVRRRGVAFMLAKLASTVARVASPSADFPSSAWFCRMVVSSMFPCPCRFWKRLIDSGIGAYVGT